MISYAYVLRRPIRKLLKDSERTSLLFLLRERGILDKGKKNSVNKEPSNCQFPEKSITLTESQGQMS